MVSCGTASLTGGPQVSATTNQATSQQQKVPASFNTCYFCKQTQNHGGEVTNSAAPAVARTTRSAKSLESEKSIVGSVKLIRVSLPLIAVAIVCRLTQRRLFCPRQQAVRSQVTSLIGFGRVIAVAPWLVILLFT